MESGQAQKGRGRGRSRGRGRETKEAATVRGRSVRAVSPDWDHPVPVVSNTKKDKVDEWDMWEAQGMFNTRKDIPPDPEFKFEPPATDAHLREKRNRGQQWEQRQLVSNLRKLDEIDCRGLHGKDEMCMFCDGRRGDWTAASAANSMRFGQYQETFLQPFTPKKEYGVAQALEEEDSEPDEEEREESESGKRSFKQFLEEEGKNYSEEDLREKFYQQLSLMMDQ